MGDINFSTSTRNCVFLVFPKRFNALFSQIQIDYFFNCLVCRTYDVEKDFDRMVKVGVFHCVDTDGKVVTPE